MSADIHTIEQLATAECWSFIMVLVGIALVGLRLEVLIKRLGRGSGTGGTK